MISRGIPPFPPHSCCRCFLPQSCVFLKASFLSVWFHFCIPSAASPSLHATAAVLCFPLAPELPSCNWPGDVLESKGRVGGGGSIKGEKKNKTTNKMHRKKKKAGFGDGSTDPTLQLSRGCETLLQATHCIFSPQCSCPWAARVVLGCPGWHMGSLVRREGRGGGKH